MEEASQLLYTLADIWNIWSVFSEHRAPRKPIGAVIVFTTANLILVEMKIDKTASRLKCAPFFMPFLPFLLFFVLFHQAKRTKQNLGGGPTKEPVG